MPRSQSSKFSQAQHDIDSERNSVANYPWSVGEINIGIMSSCMPVIFVVFRGFTIWSASWATKIWSLISRGRTQDGLSQASDIQLVRYNEMSGSHLPEVPKGSLTGLKSFMRNFHRTNPVKTQTTTVPLTYASMDYDYHAQLKQQHADARSPPLSGR
jgi:hypothetical protein